MTATLMGITIDFDRACRRIPPMMVPQTLRERFRLVKAMFVPLAPTLIFLLAVCRGQYAIAVLSLVAFGNSIMPYVRFALAEEVTADFELPISVGYVRTFVSDIDTFHVEVIKKVEYHVGLTSL